MSTQQHVLRVDGTIAHHTIFSHWPLSWLERYMNRRRDGAGARDISYDEVVEIRGRRS